MLSARQLATLATRAVFISAIFVSLTVFSPVTHALDFFGSDHSSATSTTIRDRLAESEPSDGDSRTDIQNQVLAFYQARGYRPAWSGSDRAQERAKRVLYALQHANEQGLRPSDYDSPQIEADLDQPAADTAADYDIAMSTAFLRYAHDVRVGRFVPADVYKDVDLPPQHFNAGAELNEALRHNSLDEFLDSLPPAHAEYHDLVAAMARYRAGGAQGEPQKGGSAHATAAYRIQQIAANMERWRWMPATLEPRYIRVDVPTQTLEYVRDGEVVLQSRVVIGRRTTPTPILRTTVQAVIANPAWEIADDIAARQILPHLKTSPDYLATHNITLESGQYRQAPGPNNALGQLMLDAPNPFWVYMHDTPNKELFRLDVRERSNGCVRVEQIFELASLALTDDAAAGADSLNDAIATGQTQQLMLSSPLPVYMVYWTARASEDGTVEFDPDRYGRDATLIAKLGFSSPGAKRSSGTKRIAHIKRTKARSHLETAVIFESTPASP
jgi:murein L,D-transpeptidase YcbB/YkuD